MSDQYKIRGLPAHHAVISISPADYFPSLRQSEGFLLVRISDVTHHLMRCYDNTSAHNIPTSKHNFKA